MKKKVLIIGCFIILGVVLAVTITFKILNTKSSSSKEEFMLKVHQTVILKDINMKITLKEISDSRCPRDVECFLAGELSYKLQVKYNNSTTNYTLGTFSEDTKNTIVFNKYVLKIIDYNEAWVKLKLEEK